MALTTLKTIDYKKEQSIAFEKCSEILTRYFATLDKDLEQKKTARQKVEVLLNVIKTANAKLISFKAIISQNYTSDFTGACSYLLAQVAGLHGGAQLEANSYK